MKILFLSTRFPYPPTTGDRHRTIRNFRILSENNSVCLATFYADPKELKHLAELERYCEKIFSIPLPNWRSKWNLMSAMFTRDPLNAVYFRSRKMAKLIERISGRGRFDVVISGSIRMAQYLKLCEHSARVIDYGDCASLHFRRRMDHKRDLLYPFYAMECSRLLRYEKKVHDMCDGAVVSSPVDKDALPEKDKLSVIPTFFDMPERIKEQESSEPFSIIFSGNVQYYSDEIAIIYFVREIYPLVRKKLPQAKFYIVGGKPTQKIRDLEGQGIIVTGFVEDLQHHIRKACVSVAPMKVGAGILCKVIEPMAAGTPVIVSSVANGGVQARDGQQLMIADSPDAFAEKTVELLTNSALRQRMAKEARKYVEDNFSKGVIMGNTERALRTAVESWVRKRSTMVSADN
ncbi:glycosyltransferase family 4 protein [Acidobacteriota bacterium]